MNIFSAYNLPITLVVALILWAWFSLFSALIGSFSELTRILNKKARHCRAFLFDTEDRFQLASASFIFCSALTSI